jgi:beta-lactamase class C
LLFVRFWNQVSVIGRFLINIEMIYFNIKYERKLNWFLPELNPWKTISRIANFVKKEKLKGKKFNIVLSGLGIFLILGFASQYYLSPSPEMTIAQAPVLNKKITNPYIDSLLIEYNDELQHEFEKSNIPGAAVGIVINGQIEYLKALGVKAIETNDSINLETTFRLASVSKGFSSILMGIIKEEQCLSWFDPISSYLTNFKTTPSEWTDSISIAHILSHTSGYPYQAYSNLVEEGFHRDSLIKELNNVSLSRDPGDIHSYQNVAFSMVEPVLERITQSSFKDLMRNRIFEPLEMQKASISLGTMLLDDNKALPHLPRGKSFRTIPISSAYYNVASAGGINASITDMAKWMQAITGHRESVIPQVVLDSVFSPIIPTHVRSSYFSSFDRPRLGYYGLGWRVVNYPTDTLIYHGGYANGYKSDVALNKSKDIAICVLSNAPGNFTPKMTIAFFKLYNKYQDRIKSWKAPEVVQ